MSNHLDRAVAALLLAALASACSINISPITPPGATTAPTSFIAPTHVVTVAPAASATPAASAQFTAAPIATSFTVPVTWANRRLSGQLIFSSGTDGVLRVDLATGVVSSVFQAPDPQNSWVLAAAVAPASHRIAMAYAAPPAPGAVQFGYTNLYVIADDGQPQALLDAPSEHEAYFGPAWSPDDQWLYFVHLGAPLNPQDAFHYSIQRLPCCAPGASPLTVITDAFWPRLSPDGSKLAFVHYDALTGNNSLFVAGPDGSQARQLVAPDSFQAVDAPVFTPDGQSLIFSAIPKFGSASLSWLDRLLGVRLAEADGSPADWWRMPVSGGPAMQLSQVSDTSLYASFAPDGQHIAFVSGSGLFVMNADGSDVATVVDGSQMPGSIGSATVDWVP